MPAPNIQFQELPGKQEQTNPRQYFTAGLERDKNEVKQYYSTQWNMLRKTTKDEESFRQGVLQLQAKTDAQMQQIEYGYKQKMAQLDQIMQMANQGLISSETGQRAAWQTAGFKIPQDQEPDWRLEHGRTVAEINRVQAILNAVDSKTDKAMFPKKDVKFGFGKQMEYDWEKLSPERAEQLKQLLNAKDFLLQQERSTFEKLPRMQRKATSLQATEFYRQRQQKWNKRPWDFKFPEKMPKWFAQGYNQKPVGLTEKVIADMPKAQQFKPKKLTKDIARQYLNRYGNRQAAMEAAQRDGYLE